MHQHAAGDAEHGEHDAGRQAFPERQQESAEHMFLDDDAPKTTDNF